MKEIEKPRSPVAALVIQSQYWTRTGRSVPSLALRASTAASVAKGPSTRLATSPGINWVPMKIKMLIKQHGDNSQTQPASNESRHQRANPGSQHRSDPGPHIASKVSQ